MTFALFSFCGYFCERRLLLDGLAYRLLVLKKLGSYETNDEIKIEKK